MKLEDIVNNYISFYREFEMTADQLLEVVKTYSAYFEKDDVDFGKFVADMEDYTQDNTEYFGFSEVSVLVKYLMKKLWRGSLKNHAI